MKRRMVSVMALTLLLTSMLMLAFHFQRVRGGTITVPGDYPTIQEALNAASENDTIFVRNGTYENIVVAKAVSLMGENMEGTVIDGGGSLSVVMISANNVNVSGFTIRNSGTNSAGIRLESAIHFNINIVGNNITGNFCGIWFDSSSNSSVSGNTITDNGRGVYLGFSSDYNIVSSNNITDNGFGVGLDYSSNYNTVSGNNITGNTGGGIWLGLYSNNNTISGNSIVSNGGHGIWNTECSNTTISENSVARNNGSGIILGSSSYPSYNVVSRNRIADNSENGISLMILDHCNNCIFGNNVTNNDEAGIFASPMHGAPDNTIYHNNFIDNAIQVNFTDAISSITWDDRYPSGGNYWSNYTGADLESGFYQNETDSDGIGDTPHTIDANNVDNYPLIGPISFFDAGTWNGTSYSVHVISNSTLSGFYFNPTSGTFILFYVACEPDTSSYCRVEIPKNLLWVEDGWDVYYGSTKLNCTAVEDNANTYVYFPYTNTFQNPAPSPITINGTQAVPEFPLFLVLLFFMIATLLGVMAYRKRKQSFSPHKS